ncbi:MAG: tRNA (adenosine(37)-N6)-threonylcarbamoyltransferase complex dimerization subunit type 1 TsaB [Proteobacteria bacterium]|nr:tRNA (adenosine(37)-N6)-threonylcarbamoyltransferase complex dimerization subunit type 1 TsaB [Pseudomonadota bacterium]MBU1687759.1 tRNA (adenosine(37)-N6)-threonylcarbamoyltransferase complex dimerization subunit type 1 TsaB [Pseudomonadota bacterium]
MPAAEVSGPVILAIESATMSGSVAVVTPNRCLGESTVTGTTGHSRRLPIQVQRLLDDLVLPWEAIDGIAVSLGPGSFTGLRIGLSLAKGFALATGKPLLGIPTLEGLAVQAAQHPGDRICAVVDARKNEIYCGFYQVIAPGKLEKAGDFLAIPPKNLADHLDQPTLIVGDCSQVFLELAEKLSKDRATVLLRQDLFPRAAPIGMLGVNRYLHQEINETDTLVPLYVRPSEAEINARK